MNNPMNGNSFNNQLALPWWRKPLSLVMVVCRSRRSHGGVGFIPNSGRPRNIVSGRGYQSQIPYNAQQQPNGKTMEMMEGMGLAQDSAKIMERQYGEGIPGPYRPGPMGMHPYSGPLEGGAPSPAQPDPTMTQQMFDTMPLQGLPDAQMAAGMDTKQGKRNSGKK